MTAVAWPLNLPQRFLRDGYVETPSENVSREEMDVGPNKTRLRSTAAPVTVRGRMVMTDAQLAFFRTFYTDTLFYGTVAFAMQDQTGVLREMNIVEPPQYATRTDSFLNDVAIVLEYIP